MQTPHHARTIKRPIKKESAMFSGPFLVTPRLILRPPIAQDFDAFAAMRADAQTMTFLGGAVPRSTAWRQFTSQAGAWQISGHSFFSIIERASGAWVGQTGPWAPEGWPQPEIAYGLHPQFAGRGYAYEAACAAIDFAVDMLKWDKIAHTIDPDNAASIALAKRLGASNHGPTRLPAPYQDSPVDLWMQSADQWKQRKLAE